MKLKTGDRVIVMAGKDKGKTGKITQTFPGIDKVVVEGVNQMTKYLRRQRGTAGQKVSFTGPIHVSNVMLVDPKTSKPTRVRVRRDAGKMTRVAARSGEVIS